MAWTAACLALASSLAPQPVDAVPSPLSYITIGFKKVAVKRHWDTILYGIITLIAGILYAAYGSMNHRVMGFIAGWALLDFIVLSTMYGLEPEIGYTYKGKQRDVAYFMAFLWVGVFGGLVTMRFKSLGRTVAPALGGLCCGLWLTSWFAKGMMPIPNQRMFFYVVVSFLPVLLTHFWQQPVLIAMTAAAGGYAVSIALDLFIGANLEPGLVVFLRASSLTTTSYKPRTAGYICLGIGAAVAVTGMVIQSIWFRRLGVWKRLDYEAL
ncbi:hypothetical protein CXG81DRAFT_27748 [Caulochytrium protostelioides]|uniref:TM7S3/TM198-like domain-containing protein n=1 Tax=Caulochytrium protostelioides TaxID=1555241 RepID=A0A4P9X3B3_9FUNG|nr:hypothetical protein CXG81DRAFT_27748 [Caulochytrium protostelioides]|eukprot:RKO99509.1 hypothetical protein CXG81DRAFT_27748 [Caulochytrium protostelioides]